MTVAGFAAVACDEAVWALGVDEVGIAVGTSLDSVWGLVGATGPLVTAIDDEQLRLGIGPVPDALRLGGVHGAPDLHSVRVIDHHAAFLARGATRLGVGAVFAIGLQLPTGTPAALHLVRRTPGAPIDDDAVHVHAKNVGVAIARDIDLRLMHGAAGDHWIDRFVVGRDATSRPHVGDSLTRRLRVVAAVDMVVTAERIDHHDALARLRGYGFRDDRPLSDLAELVLSGDVAVDDLMR
ncbi:hypothetical protein [uncultured Williamsia sp.]|uniref:hypothetical protein n=1 Tax=uncultured Williamsia sp. TaxID=259311 RepID=UPI0026366991|nr:hypothetical protein [uncultured Williamsia sp.]